jgi:hypothetical protein
MRGLGLFVIARLLAAHGVRLLRGALLLTLCLTMCNASVVAAEGQWVEEGQEALADGSYPWYDAETDSLRPLKLPERRTGEWDLAWIAELLGATIQIIAWTLLGLAILALAALLVYFARNRQPAAASRRATTDGLATADRIEALPFLAERPRGDLLALARQHYEAGNYSEAIIYLFSYELLQLDKFSIIRLSRGKTNRQYLREVGRQSALRSPLEQTLVTFESVFFGRRALDRAGFEACWNQLPQFEQHLQGAT